jgi:hypothetical protein
MNAPRSQPMRADDAKVIGYLYPRPIAIAIGRLFRSRAFRFEVRGFHKRLHGIQPYPVKSA